MPVVVWTLGRFVVGLEGQHLLTIVIMGALPTAQNVFRKRNATLVIQVTNL